jgi:hypothetical protein
MVIDWHALWDGPNLLWDQVVVALEGCTLGWMLPPQGQQLPHTALDHLLGGKKEEIRYVSTIVFRATSLLPSSGPLGLTPILLALSFRSAFALSFATQSSVMRPRIHRNQVKSTDTGDRPFRRVF